MAIPSPRNAHFRHLSGAFGEVWRSPARGPSHPPKTADSAMQRSFCEKKNQAGDTGRTYGPGDDSGPGPLVTPFPLTTLASAAWATPSITPHKGNYADRLQAMIWVSRGYRLPLRMTASDNPSFTISQWECFTPRHRESVVPVGALPKAAWHGIPSGTAQSSQFGFRRAISSVG